MLYVNKTENLIGKEWLQELSFRNSITVKMKAVHCRPICRAVNPSVSLKTKIDESFTPVYDVEVKIVLFCGCRFESVKNIEVFTSLDKSSFPKSNVGSSK